MRSFFALLHLTDRDDIMAYQQQPAMGPRTGAWKTGLLECFSDTNVCCDIYCCHCCANARQWDAVEGLPNSMNLMVFLANCCLGTTALLNCFVRCNITKRYNIDEGDFISCLIGTFLATCAMCQQHKELTAQGLWPGGTICANPPVGYAPPMYPAMGQPGYAPQPGYQQQQQVYQQQPPYQQQQVYQQAPPKQV